MASQDFVDLMTKLHKGKYKMLSKKMVYDGLDETPSLTATVTLEKEGTQIIIQSSERDFIEYVTGLRGVVGINGEHRFTRLKDSNQYNVDTEHLIDEDKSKLRNAADELRSKKFKFTYNPFKLIDELLKGERNLKDEKFLPLKEDYHYILANAFLISKEMMKARRVLIRKYPEAKGTIQAVDTIMKSFWPTGNAIKDYKFYRSYLRFDIDGLAKRMSTELLVTDDTIKDFLRRGTIDADIVIPKMMDIYGRFLELSAPVINLIRIGLELRRGNSSPNRDYVLGQNIKTLRSDRDYGLFFSCLDEQIRHADAHVSRRIDKVNRKIQLLDARSGREQIVGSYTFDEFADMINLMQNQFFPVIFPTLVLFDIATLDLLLMSTEYKFLLLAIGNC